MSWDQLDDAIAAQGFSGVVSVRMRGLVVYESAAGYAERANKIPNTTSTRYGIASGTKFPTTLVVGRLIDAGKLRLSTQLRECVSLELPSYTDDITIQQLLTHTSGIPDYYDEDLITDFDNFTVAVPWHELRGPTDYVAVLPDREMKFTPGDQFSGMTEFRFIITARDYDESALFYGDALGLAVANSWDRGPGARGTLFYAAQGLIEIVDRPGPHVPPVDTTRLAFEVPDPEETAARLRDRWPSAELTLTKTSYGLYELRTRDPIGVRLVMFRPVEGEYERLSGS